MVARTKITTDPVGRDPLIAPPPRAPRGVGNMVVMSARRDNPGVLPLLPLRRHPPPLGEGKEPKTAPPASNPTRRGYDAVPSPSGGGCPKGRRGRRLKFVSGTRRDQGIAPYGIGGNFGAGDHTGSPLHSTFLQIPIFIGTIFVYSLKNLFQDSFERKCCSRNVL